MPKPQPKCPNCGENVAKHANNSCVLNAFIVILREREEHNAEHLAELHASCNLDALWDDLDPIISRLGEGHYRG